MKGEISEMGNTFAIAAIVRIGNSINLQTASVECETEVEAEDYFHRLLADELPNADVVLIKAWIPIPDEHYGTLGSA